MGLRLAGVLVLAIGAAAQEAEEAMEEYQLKAGFVYNVARFVEWPPTTFSSPDQPLVACILGESPIQSVLEQAGANRTIDGRRLAAHSISAAREVVGCNLVFVSQPAQKAWRSASTSVSINGILIIGEGASVEGVIVNLKRSGEKIRLQVDLEAARRANLRISSRLLSLAEVVNR